MGNRTHAASSGKKANCIDNNQSQSCERNGVYKIIWTYFRKKVIGALLKVEQQD